MGTSQTEIFICNVKFFGSDGINSISGVCSKVNQITHRIELELELMPKNHENLSPDLDPALELIKPYQLSALPPAFPPGLASVEDEMGTLEHFHFIMKISPFLAMKS